MGVVKGESLSQGRSQTETEADGGGAEQTSLAGSTFLLEVSKHTHTQNQNQNKNRRSSSIETSWAAARFIKKGNNWPPRVDLTEVPTTSEPTPPFRSRRSALQARFSDAGLRVHARHLPISAAGIDPTVEGSYDDVCELMFIIGKLYI